MEDVVPEANRAIATTTLRPDPGAAAVWSAWSGLLVAAGVWFVLDTPRSIVAWGALVSFVAVAGYFVVQLAVPRLFEVRLTQDQLQARTLWIRRHVDWDRVHVARVRTLFGDPVLELQVREEQDGDWQLVTSDVLLPVGVRIHELHRFLATRLGTGQLPAPDRVRPL